MFLFAFRQPAYIRIRNETLNKIDSKIGRIIIASQFTATPRLEKEYYPQIKDRPEYLQMYEDWVLAQGPLPHLPNDAELFRLRENVIGGSEEQLECKDLALLNLFLDMIYPFLTPHVSFALRYRDLEPKTQEDESKILLAVKTAAVHALKLCDKEHVEREGYDSFITAFADFFRVIFCEETKREPWQASVDNKEFAAAFKIEWEKLHAYSDWMYGFEVIPIFSSQDIFRYLRLPIVDTKFAPLRKEKAYRQIMNYVAAMTTFKPVPDGRIRAYYRQELCGLFMPFIAKNANFLAKKLYDPRVEEELRRHLEKRLAELAQNFDYFYASTQKLVRKTGSFTSRDLLLPLRGRLARLGHIFQLEEYPFTRYITRKLEKEVGLYLGETELSSEGISLEEALGNNGDLEYGLDALESEEVSLREHHIPDYDAQDASGEIIGWKIKTFSKITGKGVSTLQRWDRRGILKPIRYNIYSKPHRKEIPYRAYTREDYAKIPDIVEMMEKKMLHH